MSRRRRKPGAAARKRGRDQRAHGADRGGGRHGSIAATRAASRRPTSWPSPTRSTALPGRALRRRHDLSGIAVRSRDPQGEADAESGNLAQGGGGPRGRRTGRIEVNAPGTTSSATVQALAEAGRHADRARPRPDRERRRYMRSRTFPKSRQSVYLSEVSHLAGGEAFCFGGGLYIDPVFPDYPVRAIVSHEPTAAVEALRNVEIPATGRHRLLRHDRRERSIEASAGDSVVFGFRAQAFVTATTTGTSRCAGVSDVLLQNRPVGRPRHPPRRRARHPHALRARGPPHASRLRGRPMSSPMSPGPGRLDGLHPGAAPVRVGQAADRR